MMSSDASAEAKRYAEAALSVGDAFKFTGMIAQSDEALATFPEVQVAITAATTSARTAIGMAATMNDLRKVATGKTLTGKLTTESQDCLRSALLFSGAGLDTGLKRLAREALPRLVPFDAAVGKRFHAFAENAISDESGGTNPKELVRLLLGKGENPRDIMVGRWIESLEAHSAQSAQRVSEIAQALGVENAELRRRIGPSTQRSLTLERAFAARNQIAHELDVTTPEDAARKRLENIRHYRRRDEMISFCEEILEVTQLIVNDVVARVQALPASPS